MLQVWIQNLCINEHMQGKAHSVHLILCSILFTFHFRCVLLH